MNKKILTNFILGRQKIPITTKKPKIRMYVKTQKRNKLKNECSM